MTLTSLPDRPLELRELQDLNESSRFRAVLPAAAFDLEKSDYTLVPVAVLVTDQVIGVGYDDGVGWTQIGGRLAADEEPGLEEQARAMNRRIREWAEETGQQWAEPDGADSLLAAFED